MAEDRLNRVVRALVMRFRRQKPLRSGSLLVTILGDAIAPRGGAVTLGSLIKLAEPFGLPERLVRTSVGRLAQDGWLSSRRAGRQSEYALTRHGRKRFAEATQRIYSAPPRDWEHLWTLVLLASSRSDGRDRMREELLWLGFGQVAPGVLAHPSRSVADTQRQLKEMKMINHAVVLQAQSGGLEQDRQLIATGWDLDGLARRYRRFADSFNETRKTLATGVALRPEQAFVIRTLLIHEYRKIHLRDPLLPHDLLPASWIGAGAYQLCRELYCRVSALAEEHLSRNARQLQGGLDPPSREVSRRFGE